MWTWIWLQPWTCKVLIDCSTVIHTWRMLKTKSCNRSKLSRWLHWSLPKHVRFYLFKCTFGRLHYEIILSWRASKSLYLTWFSLCRFVLTIIRCSHFGGKLSEDGKVWFSFLAKILGLGIYNLIRPFTYISSSTSTSKLVTTITDKEEFSLADHVEEK